MSFLEPVFLIKTAGYIGLFAIVFAESGLLIGFFLPGDSLLLTAGFLASQGFLNIWFLVPLVFSAAILGDNVGYAFGRRMGPRIFKREDSIFFHKDHAKRAEEFYRVHGAKTLVLARFTPVIRTFAPIVAGIGRMQYQTFLFYNIVGAALWTAGMSLLGFFLGEFVPGIDQYIVSVILVIVSVSMLPGLFHIIREYLAHKRRSR